MQKETLFDLYFLSLEIGEGFEKYALFYKKNKKYYIAFVDKKEEATLFDSIQKIEEQIKLTDKIDLDQLKIRRKTGVFK